MIGIRTETRCRTLRLPDNIGENERRKLDDKLMHLDAIERVDIDAHQCHVQYNFPDTTFTAILTCTEAVIGPFPSVLDRLRHSFLAVMEDNERDYRLHPCGWHFALQNIHAHRFDTRHTGSRDDRRQQWQQYTGGRRTAETDPEPRP